MRALGSWKPKLIMASVLPPPIVLMTFYSPQKLLVDFVSRLKNRIAKETGMPLNGATKIVGNSRFKKLFCLEEFMLMMLNLLPRALIIAQNLPGHLKVQG